MRPSRVIESGDARLAVYERGDPAAPTIVFVHGYPDTHRLWDAVADRLDGDFHVVTYDVRGFGASSGPPPADDRRGRSPSGAPSRDPRPYGVDALARDLFAVAEAVSPDRPVHVVGHDWGSVQSWEAVTEPGARERIASFTSISGPCLDHLSHWIRSRLRRPTPRRLRQLLRQQLKSYYIAGFQVPVLPELVLRYGVIPSWPAVLRRREGVPAASARPAPTFAADAVHGLALYRENFGSLSNAPRDRYAQVPVQLLVPAEDHFLTPSALSDIERWVPELWHRGLASGHWAPLVRPAAVARMVAEFVRHVGGAAPTRALRRDRVGTPGRRPFTDRLVVVTGAASGIGRAAAHAFGAQRAEVVCVDIDGPGAERTAARIRARGGLAHGRRVDVTDEDAMRALAADVARDHGVPDVVVNNAGIGVAGPFLRTTDAEWRRTLDTNLMGVVHGCREFGLLMAEHGEGGHIVNVASAAAYLPSRMLPAYGASKAAVLMLSDSIRGELAESRIGISTVCPGFTDTGIAGRARFVGTSADEERRLRARSVRRFRLRDLGPEKVAVAIMRAAHHDLPVVPVGVEASAGRWLTRIAPGLVRAGARVDLLPKARTPAARRSASG